MCKKFLSLLLSLTILLGAVWVPVGATADTTPQTVTFLFRDFHNPSSGFSKDITAEVGDLYLLLFEKAGTPTLTGYVFKGWYKSGDTSQNVIANTATVDNSAKQVILEAKWEPIKYIVTYNPNYSGSTNISSEVTFGKKYSEATGGIPTPASRDGYSFVGWFTSASSGTQITDLTPVTTASNHTLYAHWTTLTHKVELYYDTTGANLSNKPAKETLDVAHGSKIGSIKKPVRSGYDCVWGKGVSGSYTSNVYDDEDPIESDSKLYARWKPKTFTVTLNPNGGELANDTKTVTATYASNYPDIKTNNVPTRTGYTFNGWFTAIDGGTEVTSSISVTATQDHTLYAHWTPNKYNLSFNYAFPNGAAWKDATGTPLPTPTPPTITEKATYDAAYPALPTPPANDIPYYGADSTQQYTFNGWYDLEKDTVDTSDPTQNKTGQKITGGNNGTIYTYDDGTDKQTLYARWGYKIEFFANNTDDVTKESAIGTLDCVTGSPYKVSGMPRDPVNPGYTFAGWYESAEASDADKVELSASDIANGSINKLYAHWTPAEYDVTFDANGGEVTKKTKTVTFGEEYGALPNPDNRTGYEFAGWFTEKTGGTEVTATTKAATAKDHILYAHWNPLEITLNFDYNFPDKSITEDTTSTTHPHLPSTTATYGAQYGKALPAVNPKDVTSDDKVTYTFAGWYTMDKDKNADSSGKDEVTGQRVQSSYPVELEYKNNSATLYARWSYKVNFYANINPEATSQSPISSINFNAVSGSRYGKLPEQPGGNPSKYFLGWFTEPVGGTEIKATSIADGTTVKLYAHWGDTRVCTVTVNGNGATLPDGYPTSEIIEYGQDYSKLFSNISDPTRDGYTFMGWYLNPEGTGSAVTSRSTVTGDCTIYAKWKIDAFKVTLNLNYGSNSSVKTVDYGTKLSTVLTSPERTGYAFEGWFTDSKCEVPADTEAVVTADITLYAKWVEAKRVNLVVNGGTLPSGTPAYINVYEGGNYSKLPDPTWPGCTFLGWFDKESGGTQVRYSDKVPATSSIPSTLYAQWSPMDVTVTFDPNGAVNVSSHSRTYKVGATYGTGLSNLLWSGHEFMGWYTQAKGGTKVESSTVITVKSNTDLEITLYAHWGYKVSFDPTDGNGSMESQVAEMDQPYTLPVCTFTPPQGMRFDGWAAGTPEAATKYPGGSQYTVSRQVVFYATWTTAPIVITASSTSGGTLRTDDGRTNEVTVERGQDITFVTQANSGYVLKELIVDGTSWNYVDVHTFKNVTENHTIHAVFEPAGSPSYSTCNHGSSCPLSKYNDLSSGDWYHDGIHYCVDNVIMGGTGSDRFYPRRNTTRAELAVSLYNYTGRPEIVSSGLLPNTYTDVKAGDWHYQAIEWATKQGILAGFGNGKFKPNQSVTREQLVAILWRHAGEPKPRSTVLRFNDSGSVSDYAWEAMCWATEQGILQGRSNGYLAPKGTATRAEVAEMLKNYLGK